MYGMIDLREMVIKAAKKGVQLYVTFELRGIGPFPGASMIIRGKRGECVSICEVQPSMVAQYGTDQEKASDVILDRIFRHLDDLEEKLIREGGTE